MCYGVIIKHLKYKQTNHNSAQKFIGLTIFLRFDVTNLVLHIADEPEDLKGDLSQHGLHRECCIG